MPESMREAFREHHRLATEEFEQLLAECIFALDANVLLNIYRYADATRRDFFDVLKHLKKRIRVPYRAAEEFYQNRIPVIQDQAAKYAQLSKAVLNSLEQLNDGAFRKSGFLKVADLEGVLKPAVDKATALIEAQRTQHPDLLRKDPYLEELVEIIGDSIGEGPTPEEREKASEEAQRRIDRNQPPGIGPDSKKQPPNRYGDIFIWFELIDLSKKEKKPVVFITDDYKDDWWHTVSGQRLGGPRPELRREMRTKANVEFYLYDTAKFLEMIGNLQDVKVAPSSIDNAKEIGAQLQREAEAASVDDQEKPSRRDVKGARNIIALWISVRYPGSAVAETEQAGRFFLVHASGVVVDVHTSILGVGYDSYVEEKIASAEKAMKAADRQSLLVFASRNPGTVKRVTKYVAQRRLAQGLEVIVGRLREDRFDEAAVFQRKPHSS